MAILLKIIVELWLSENLKKQMILALFIFNIAILATYSQPKKRGWGVRTDDHLRASKATTRQATGT